MQAKMQGNRDSDERDKPKMINLANGQVVPIFNQAVHPREQVQESNLGRKNLFQLLKSRSAQQQQAELNIEQLKSSFVVRDLNSKRKEGHDKVVVDDALAYDIEKGKDPNRDEIDRVLDDDDDDDYDPNEVQRNSQENDQPENHEQ